MTSKRYELNTGALTASPRPTNEWIDCEVLGKNAGGQYYVSPRSGNRSRVPFYVFPEFVRVKQ